MRRLGKMGRNCRLACVRAAFKWEIPINFNGKLSMTKVSSSSHSNHTTFVDKPVNANVGVSDNLDAHYPPPLHEANNHRLQTPGRPMSLLLAGKAGLILSAKILWAGPWSLWGLGIGGVGLLSGGGVQWSGRVLEFWGGLLPVFLKYFPFVAGSPVATFGHVVVGRTQRHLDACRPHQLVHVKQYELWGPLFVPCYLICWGVLWCCGKRPYYDNPFEREAYGQTS
jgi:hypothetical protein